MFRLVLLGGFLGAGKTTTALTAARQLRARGHRVAIVTNDQGTDLVDTRLAEWHLGARGFGGAAGEVTGGCVCCRLGDLAATVPAAARQAQADTATPPAVASCPALPAAAIRPPRRYSPVGESAAP